MKKKQSNFVPTQAIAMCLHHFADEVQIYFRDNGKLPETPEWNCKGHDKGKGSAVIQEHLMEGLFDHHLQIEEDLVLYEGGNFQNAIFLEPQMFQERNLWQGRNTNAVILELPSSVSQVLLDKQLTKKPEE